MNLKIKIGCDIINLKRFEKLIENQNKTALTNLFSQYELSVNISTKSLAGVFAAKESVLKALELKPGMWNNIEIIKQPNGKPTIKLIGFNEFEIISSDISISHDGDYILATASFLIK